MKQQPRGRKRKTEGEGDDGDRPAQRIQANLAKLAMATELLIDGREYYVSEKAINDPKYGSK